jgi:hypothetical protein
MKKVILVFAICLGFAITATACKGKAHEHSEDTHMHDEGGEASEAGEESSEEMASNTLYQCPMDCEKGKSYNKEGKCPVCEMALKAKTVDMDADENHSEDHDEEETHEHDHGTEGAHEGAHQS